MRQETVLDWVLGISFGFLGAIIVVSTLVEWIKDNRLEKEYGTETYEVVITNKYDCLGSTFHVVGGRSTETEYHLVYKYRCTNRPNNEHLSSWKEIDKKVSYITWSKYNTGERFTTNKKPCLLN